MAIRFLLDENMPHAVRDQLLLREPTLAAICVGEAGAPSFGTDDPTILDWIEAESYVLVSRNRSTMPGHLASHFVQGKHMPGLLLVRGQVAWSKILDDLIFIWGNCSDDELVDQIVYLPL